MTADSARFERINALLEQALDLPGEQREAFVESACGADRALFDEVMALLAFDAERSDGLRQSLDVAAEALDDPAAPQIGGQIGSWRILRKIAEGGMGMVYLAERADADFEQQAAIKLLPRHRLDTHSAARFVEERRILASLQHPNIARLLDGGTLEGGAAYLVMEFVDGMPIDRYCREQSLDNAAILRLVLKVCAAVQFAHGKLVVHRDIKPSNILVTAQGEPMLLDFGIAKLLDADSSHSATLTRTDWRLFTPLYASPEQVEGGAITIAVDVYALGLLLYLLLTGRLPYADTRSHPRELEQRILSGPRLPPSEAVTSKNVKAAGRPAQWAKHQRRALRGDLDTVVMMALRKEPERRYATVAALAEDLQLSLQRRPVKARADSVSYRVSQLLRRHPVAVPVSALALVLAIAGAATFSWLLAAQRDEALQQQARAVTAAEFSASLLSRTGASQDSARTLTVRELLDTAAERVDIELADAPQVALQMRLALADSYATWGHSEESIAQAARGLALAEAEADQRQQARALHMLSVGHHGLRQLDLSLNYSQRALALWEQIGTPVEKGNALTTVALGLNSLRRRDEAAPVFQRALHQLREAHDSDHTDIAWLLNNLAWCLHTLGDLAQARVHYEEGLAMQERLGDSQLELAKSQHNLAALYFDEGDLDRAEQLWQHTLAEFESLYGSDGHTAVARGQSVLGMVARSRGDNAGALQRSGEAVRINLELLGDVHPWTAHTLLGLALAHLNAGELERTESLLSQALEIYEAAEPPNPIDLANTRLALGRLALARDDLARSEIELQDARALLGQLTSPDRTPIDEIEMTLGRVIAAQGRREEGHNVAALAVQRLRASRPADDWRRQTAEALLQLPPFVEAPSEEAQAQARATIDFLHQRIGSNEPGSVQLARALAGGDD